MTLKNITTKKGDSGSTVVLHSGLVSKNDHYIKFVGTIDELVSFIGVARVSSKNILIKKRLEEIQRSLFDLAADVNDFGSRINQEFIDSFETKHEYLAKLVEYPKDFILPGGRDSVSGGFIDVCRAISRRLERDFYDLYASIMYTTEHESRLNVETVRIYLNRLSDHLWYLARLEEGDSLMQKEQNA